MTLTTAQSKECSKLVENLISTPTKVGDVDQEEPLEESFVEDEDDEEEDSTEPGSAQEEIVNCKIPLAVLSSFVGYSMMDKLVLEFLSALFTHLPTADDDKFYTPLVRFLILESYQRHGNWLPPRRITEVISVLTFVGRQVMFYEALKSMSPEQEYRYSL